MSKASESIMHEEESNNIADRLKTHGLASLAYAQQHILLYENDDPYWHNFAVLQTAHAAEILLKAIIAEQHPSLIFSDFLRLTKNLEDKSISRELFEEGETLSYNQLPEKLWEIKRYKLRDENLYRRFGKLKNTIPYTIHQGQQSLKQEILTFIYGVIDPLINDFWRLYAVHYVDLAGDPDSLENIVEHLLKLNIDFLIPGSDREMVKNLRSKLNRL
jgi:hypothetical protein